MLGKVTGALPSSPLPARRVCGPGACDPGTLHAILSHELERPEEVLRAEFRADAVRGKVARVPGRQAGRLGVAPLRREKGVAGERILQVGSFTFSAILGSPPFFR
jgi:hypothetical protein